MIRFAVFIIFAIGFLVWYIRNKREVSYSERYRSVDAIVPAFNEESCIENVVRDLLGNRYIRQVIAVNDGSTDRTRAILETLKASHPERLLVLHQGNHGKSAALNNALQYVTTPLVLTTDADTRIPDGLGIGYLMSHIKGRVVAACGVPASNLEKAGLLPKIRASIKVSFTVLRKCAMEVIGGSPHVISGSCGLYKAAVIKEIGFSSRTHVEDMDLTWELVKRGYRVAQSSRCVVYVQECNSLREELKRWARWIAGYAMCMRLHRKLMLSRFGLGVVLPVALLGIFGLTLFYILPIILFYVMPNSAFPGWVAWSARTDWGPFPWWVIISPFWIPIVLVLSAYSAYVQKRWSLVLYSPLAVLVLLISLYSWLRWGIPTLITGREPARVKPVRY